MENPEWVNKIIELMEESEKAEMADDKVDS